MYGDREGRDDRGKEMKGRRKGEEGGGALGVEERYCYAVRCERMAAGR